MGLIFFIIPNGLMTYDLKSADTIQLLWNQKQSVSCFKEIAVIRSELCKKI